MANQFIDLRMSTNTGHVVTNLNRFATQIPQMEKDLSYKIARLFMREIRSMARVVFDDFTGKLNKALSDSQSIQAFKKGKGGWQHRINIRRPFEGGRQGDVLGWNEFAEQGHWVPTYDTGSGISNAPIRDYLGQFSWPQGFPLHVYVRPRPFAKEAIQPAARKMRKMAPREVERFLDRSLGDNSA